MTQRSQLRPQGRPVDRQSASSGGVSGQGARHLAPQVASNMPMWVVPVGFVMVAVVVMLGYGLLASHRHAGALETVIADQSDTIQNYEALPDCDPAAGDQKRIKGLIDKGSLDTAAGLAETTLAQGDLPLCSEVQAALAGFWYGARMDLLLSVERPSWYDSALDQSLVARWNEIERRADDYHLPESERWADMTVAIRASNAGLWALADAAFRRAWDARQAGEAPAAFRYALLRNWGHHLGMSGGPAGHDQAMRLLATAVAIADAINIPAGEACDDIETLFAVTDCRSVAPDRTDPVLATQAGQ